MKQALGRPLFKERTHAVIHHHFGHDVWQCQVEVRPTRIRIGDEVVVRFRMVRDSGNLAYASLLTASDWDRLSSDKHTHRFRPASMVMSKACLSELFETTKVGWSR